MEVNLHNYERLFGTEELGIYEYTGEYESAPEYVLADAYGNQFQFESGEISQLVQLFKSTSDYETE